MMRQGSQKSPIIPFEGVVKTKYQEFFISIQRTKDVDIEENNIKGLHMMLHHTQF